jgi:hypothetical protein
MIEPKALVKLDFSWYKEELATNPSPDRQVSVSLAVGTGGPYHLPQRLLI